MFGVDGKFDTKFVGVLLAIFRLLAESYNRIAKKICYRLRCIICYFLLKVIHLIKDGISIQRWFQCIVTKRLKLSL